MNGARSVKNGVLRILHLEDHPRDVELVAGWLEDEGIACEIRAVDTATQFLSALEGRDVDLIISDYHLPGFDGLKALRMARERLPDAPFILFSGTIGEELAIESLKQGATDYVLKQRPQRLITAIRHALAEAGERAKAKQAEMKVKELEAQFLRAQRMQSIGALAGGIAHDLNNMLAPILVAAELLGEERDAEERKKMLRMVQNCAQRGSEMVKQILSFARGAGGPAGPLDVTPVVMEMGRLAKDTFPRSIHIHVTADPDLPAVLGNGTQLHQVLLNLCVNARDAMPGGGELELSAGQVSLDSYVPKGEAQAVSGNYVVLSVSDTGHGMAPEVAAKIFEPFFSTKGEGKGTGLGLSTVIGIVKSHNGFLEMSSQAGRGTTFKVYLPASAESVTQTVAQNEAPLPMGRGEQILVVDDERAFLEMTRASLEAFNYRVLMAENGAEALAIYQRQHREIQAVITDMMMPIMDGPTSIEALKRIEPAVKVIGVSGLGSESALTKAGKVKVQKFLKKPYATASLLTSLREVLTEAG